MKPFYWFVLAVTVILAVATPALAAPKNNVSTQKTVTASAVIVPAQVSEMGFLISGIVKDIPVQEGDTVTTGQTLMVLDTPELQFAVSEAEARVRAAQAEVGIRRNEVIKKIVARSRIWPAGGRIGSGQKYSSNSRRITCARRHRRAAWRN